MTSTPVAEALADLRQNVSGWRKAGERVALVPTMGALHEGHLGLVRLARQHAERVVVSIFVNPTQFGPNEDFAKYPRTFEEDRSKLAGLADLVFAPAVETMYPPGDATFVTVAGPATVGLEDSFRPTHFRGVATVVAKLFLQVQPDVAVFGEKDYQQLQVIRRMVADLQFPITIIPGPTLRTEDGLAMSSRNRYLSEDEREQAAIINQTLRQCAEEIRETNDVEGALEAGRAVLSKAEFDIDYLEARDAETLAPVTDLSAKIRILVAARLGTTRLIDNIEA
ncbi:pantoate--beta-alanine ligase [Microvirga flavescens]|uniref:pantoate--beta-alanine ligase n=1 Tax=Microvirga flavescens TaxID=2249811 RepID=UPI000DDA277F|nr:pantoate--beta-alanine ligase [Microvirga flavescens]